MTLSLSVAARDAWRRWTTERGIIVAIAGPFLFLPLFAFLLLAQEPAKLDGLTQAQQIEATTLWFGELLPWLIGRVGFELFATVAVASLFLARNHRTVRELLWRSFSALPLFAVAVMTSWGLVALGALPALFLTGASGGMLLIATPILLIPAYYIYGRVALTGPALVAEPGIGFTGAIIRSVALTYGNGWRVFAILAVPILIGLALLQVMTGLEEAFKVGNEINPIARVIIDGLAALAATASGLARVLLQVSLYRRLATPRHGI